MAAAARPARITSLSRARRRGLRRNRASADDLLVVGPGVLGSLVAAQWLEATPAAKVVGQTNSDASHERLRELGVVPRTRAAAGKERYPFVCFSAPPSGCDDYGAAVREAAALWDGTGGFVFTSSSAVYAEDGGGVVHEASATVPAGAGPRTDRLLRAEGSALEVGGVVVRLAGLYTATRGAHMYFLKATAPLKSSGDGLVNQLHYEDAAALCVAALRSRRRGAVYVGTDDAPVSRRRVAECALATGRFGPEARLPTFEGASDSGDSDAQRARRNKVLSNAKTRAELAWAPKYASFDAFMTAYSVLSGLLHVRA